METSEHLDEFIQSLDIKVKSVDKDVAQETIEQARRLLQNFIWHPETNQGVQEKCKVALELLASLSRLHISEVISDKGHVLKLADARNQLWMEYDDRFKNELQIRGALREYTMSFLDDVERKAEYQALDMEEQAMLRTRLLENLSDSSDTSERSRIIKLLNPQQQKEIALSQEEREEQFEKLLKDNYGHVSLTPYMRTGGYPYVVFDVNTGFYYIKRADVIEVLEF